MTIAMKKTLIYTALLALAASGLTACNDLDTQPNGKYVSTQEKEEAIGSRPELASAGVVGISSTYNQLFGVYSSTEPHCDFGWPSVMLFLDCIGPDLVSPNIGYNWFAGSGDYDYGTSNNYLNNLSWDYAYKVILASNDVLKNIPADTDDPTLQLYAAQGYANRAFMYFNLAQLYQYTYKGHESLPCVPILTVENADEAAANGCPRSTVEEVYAQILSDLDTAIRMLTDCGMDVSSIAETGVKRFVSLGTAYGLRARVNLVMNNWKAAADDAAAAIAKSGAVPLSMSEASAPGFSTMTAANWMWGIYVQENDDVVVSTICNFPSHMGSLCYGYASVGSWRSISASLYASIPDTDVRKGWWLNEDGESANLTPQMANYLAANYAVPYTQVKFAPYQNSVGTSTNACDIPLMRVEEMYLIEAEATAMGGNPAGGKQKLEAFVKAYRDPQYSCTASDAAGVQDAVWQQRRVELFGEGFCYFDLLRLNKGLDRRGGGWTTTWVYNVPAPLKPLLIPNDELQANQAITSNNESWTRPSAVDDY